MKKSFFAFLTALFLVIYTVSAQISSDCSTAITICNNTPVNGGAFNYGFDDFNGAITSGCLEQTGIAGTIESNSGWYKFRTNASGQLGFNIGFDTSEDWDFALYRSSDCNNLGEPIRCNFYDNADSNAFMGVGEDPTGNIDTFLYEDWLQVEPGEDYYLLINNYTNINSGFSVQFSGTIFETNPYDALDCAIITNLLGAPIAACENESVVLDATTTGATHYNWYENTGGGFSLMSGENNPTLNILNAALYRVEVITPTGNIYSDVQVSFSVTPISFDATDEIYCFAENTTYDLSQKNMEVIGGQNPLKILISYHSTLIDALSGFNKLPMEYEMSEGVNTIYVRVASIDNPNCYDAPSSFELTAIATPEAIFSTEVFLCDDVQTATIGDENLNNSYTYLWETGENTPTIEVTQAGTYGLTITNTYLGQSCSEIFTIAVFISNAPEITDVEIEDLQKNNRVTVITDVVGDFEFALDDGGFQSHNVFEDVPPGEHIVRIRDLEGCGETSENIMVVGFPKFFTPNGDGTHDSWRIEGITTLQNPEVHVFDKFGKLLAILNTTTLEWDGTYLGRPLPATDYWFKLTYIDSNEQKVEAKYIDNHFSLRR